MTLDTKYDTFYSADAARAAHADVILQGWPRNRLEAILHLPLRGDTILDVGCGDGLLLYQFRSRFRRLIGLEYSANRLEAARLQMQGLSFEGLCGSAEAMPQLASNSVDVIVSADVIEHIPDVYLATDEMFRVLRPGGLLAINTPNIAFLKKRLRLVVGRFPATSQSNEGLGSDVLFDGGHLHYFTYRSLALVLQRSGFVIQKRQGFGPLGRLHNIWPALLSVGVQLIAGKPAITNDGGTVPTWLACRTRVGTDVTIKELAEAVKSVVAYAGDIAFDASKPDGTTRKLMDVGRLHTTGWRVKTAFKDGLSNAYQDFWKAQESAMPMWSVDAVAAAIAGLMLSDVTRISTRPQRPPRPQKFR